MSAHLLWQPRNLLLAPHRLGFFLAMVLLWCAGLWWALVQWDRLTGMLGLGYVLSPSLVHGAAMTFGFIPLFFSGFLFTAGPKWLGVAPPEAPQLLAPLLLQAAGWLLWLAGVHVHLALGVGGLALAFAGLLWMSVLFWRLVLRSPVTDQLHARVIAWACGVGCLSVLGLLTSVVAGADAVALACVLTGLWGFVVAVYVVVAHRMIPFFTSSAMPQVAAWRPFWALGLMLAVVVLEVLAAWVDLLQPLGHGVAAAAWHAGAGGRCRAAVAGCGVGLGAEPEKPFAGHAAHRLCLAGPSLAAGGCQPVAQLGHGHTSAAAGRAARTHHGLPSVAHAGHGDPGVRRPQRSRAGGGWPGVGVVFAAAGRHAAACAGRLALRLWCMAALVRGVRVVWSDGAVGWPAGQLVREAAPGWACRITFQARTFADDF